MSAIETASVEKGNFVVRLEYHRKEDSFDETFILLKCHLFNEAVLRIITLFYY